jgi:hypothetical protein
MRREKSVKYIPAAPVNHVRACLSLGTRFGVVIHPEIIIDNQRLI